MSSGSLYVTSNTFFSEISDLSCMLEDMVLAEPETEKVNLYFLLSVSALCSI